MARTRWMSVLYSPLSRRVQRSRQSAFQRPMTYHRLQRNTLPIYDIPTPLLRLCSVRTRSFSTAGHGDEEETVLLIKVRNIKEVLEEKVKPYVHSDGGDVEFCGFDPANGTVYIRLLGACISCSSSTVTLRFRIENVLKHYVEEVNDVKAVEHPNEEVEDEG